MTNQPTQYLAVIPMWLSQVIESEDGQKSEVAKKLKSYKDLASILSAVDVCYYHLYNAHAEKYVGTDFDDMCNITTCPDNQAWLEEHSRELQTARISFESIFNKNLEKLTEKSVPVTMRKSTYYPLAVGCDLLALVSNSGQELAGVDFYERCCTELSKQHRISGVSHFKVFSRFTRV